ncbi:M61 family metallopeptidase [Glaciecola petra]|uniref:PDZ domain-containing protein n=1 Tax=Glaciecola petra TaxID=3075602 RepID=A0ABU2ZSM2_9ALTE|nr:PDZ domain-containing protein [Aestuariibacter sp. P117]MDT0594427.1 PDZ domain-containing protein [Aestuariibacter sp. P117]
MPAQTIQYTVSVISPHEHLFKVKLSASIAPTTKTQLTLPAWIPGSYMIRDFSRNLIELNCLTKTLCLSQTDKQTWSLEHVRGEVFHNVELEYEIYAYDLSVRSAYIDDEYAFFNGTSLFLSIEGTENAEHILYVDCKSMGKSADVATAMTPVVNDSKNTDNVAQYTSTNYLEFIDHPVIFGLFTKHSFSYKGCEFHLVFTGQNNLDLHRLQKDLEPIISHHLALFGEIPCKEYWFMTLVCDKGFGGLEHLNSTVLQYSRFDLPLFNAATANDFRTDGNNEMEKEYQTFLSLCSHELFHTWHVKRIKPEVMQQPNLSVETYTPQLWIYEGFTSLYDDLSLARAKVISPKKYLEILNQVISRLLNNPGRFKQSVAQSSFEAWNKFYKQDAGSNNHIVSYYNKGTIVALCLDILLRQHSQEAVSLDTIMLDLWQDYGKVNKGTPDNVIQQICKEKYNIDLDSFIHMATQTTLDLPLPSLLQHIGIQLNTRPKQNMQDTGGELKIHYNVDIGANLAMNNQQLSVISVQQGRAAALAGMHIDDVIIAVNGWQCNEKRFYQILQQQAKGESVPIHVMRDGRLKQLHFELSPAIDDICVLEIADKAKFENWLGLN